MQSSLQPAKTPDEAPAARAIVAQPRHFRLLAPWLQLVLTGPLSGLAVRTPGSCVQPAKSCRHMVRKSSQKPVTASHAMANRS